MKPEEFILAALNEDVGNGDHSSLSSVMPDMQSTAIIKSKENGIIAGLEEAVMVLHLADKNLIYNWNVKDGDSVNNGTAIGEINGNAQSLLKAERLLLNIMQRMSGIATYTSFLNNKIKHTSCKLLDTRKTTPNFRYFEKKAVKLGGGENHRFGLYDMIMLKDNHVDFAGGIKIAIEKANEYLQKNNLNLKIEIECRNLSELHTILKTGKIDRIMLDNFSVEDLVTAVNMIAKRHETEASGGINEQNIIAYAETGVDFISVGALTHSYRSLDISMKAKIK